MASPERLLPQCQAVGSALRPKAKATAIAHLVNVTEGRSYAKIAPAIKRDYATFEYQATYLITRATNEPCPLLIWQLRNAEAASRMRKTPSAQQDSPPNHNDTTKP